MPAKPDIIHHVEELLQPLGHIHSRAMFGGWGVYCDSLMFGLFADDVFYLKVDDDSRSDFEDEDLEPFRYEGKDGKSMTMSYYEAPAGIYDNEEEALSWGRKGLDAALRQQAKKKKKKKKSK